jgi:hypothetical protein
LDWLCFLGHAVSMAWRLCFGFVPRGQIESKELGGFVLGLIWVCFLSYVIDSN